MKRILLIVCLVTNGLQLAAQDKDITHIRELYAQTQDLINTSKIVSDDPHGGLYCNEIVVNKYGTQWRAVGNYLRTIRFWYNDQPRFAAEIKGNPESALVKVEISSGWSDGNNEDYELLYEDGKLIFAFRSDASYDNKNAAHEYRWYFNNNVLILYMEDQQIIAELPDAKEILTMSDQMIKLFLATFN
jgi:hypothetical protein